MLVTRTIMTIPITYSIMSDGDRNRPTSTLFRGFFKDFYVEMIYSIYI